MVPLGPELRFYVGDRLLWSRVYQARDGGGGVLGDMAEEKKREFAALGWMPKPTEPDLR